jgi:predicted ATPase
MNSADILSPMVSEGTIIALGLITFVLSPFRPKTILIDDLERGLHPKAQREVVRVLKQILESDPDLQIIATSHSPYILDELDPREVLLATSDEDGRTICGRLPEHPDFERWKEEMTPGEFWSVVGEQWLKPTIAAEPSR